MSWSILSARQSRRRSVRRQEDIRPSVSFRRFGLRSMMSWVFWNRHLQQRCVISNRADVLQSLPSTRWKTALPNRCSGAWHRVASARLNCPSACATINLKSRLSASQSRRQAKSLTIIPGLKVPSCGSRRSCQLFRLRKEETADVSTTGRRFFGASAAFS